MVKIHVDLQKVSKEKHHRPHKREVNAWFLAIYQTLQQQATLPNQQLLRDDYSLTLRIVDEDESIKLNNRFRSVNHPTNVLSFPFDSPVKETDNYLGDLVICGKVIEQEAHEFQIPVKDYWARIFVHGCLHLFGYTHDQKKDHDQMEQVSEACLQLMSART